MEEVVLPAVIVVPDARRAALLKDRSFLEVGDGWMWCLLVVRVREVGCRSLVAAAGSVVDEVSRSEAA